MKLTSDDNADMVRITDVLADEPINTFETTPVQLFEHATGTVVERPTMASVRESVARLESRYAEELREPCECGDCPECAAEVAEHFELKRAIMESSYQGFLWGECEEEA